MANTTTNKKYLYGGLENFQVILYNKYDPTKKLDITGNIIDATIYEDIFSHSMFGSISIMDAIDLLNAISLKSIGAANPPSKSNSFPIVGEEVIRLVYNVVGNKTIDSVYEVYGISEIFTDQNLKVRTFNLKFCSREQIVDSYTLIQKGFHQPISNTAQTIFQTFLTTEVTNVYSNNNFNTLANFPKPKDIIVEPTNGNQKIVIPRLSPFESMDFLRKRSLSSTNPSGTYLFFETMDNYYFCDMEFLIKQGIQKQANSSYSNGTFTYTLASQIIKPDTDITSKETANNITSQYKSVTSVTQHNKFDTIEKLKLGVYESDIFLYDFLNTSVSNPHFKLSAAPTVTTLGKNIENSKSFLAQVNNKYTRKFFLPIDSSVPNTYIEQILPRKTSYFARLAENSFTIDTIGDTNIKAGDVINFDFPTLIDDGQVSPNKDRFLSGNFLVGSIMHKLTPIAYHATMDIYKIGYESAVESPADDNPNYSSLTPTFNTANNVNGYNQQ